MAEAASAGTPVGTVSAHDPDAGDTLVYALTEDAGGRFAIDPESGVLSVTASSRASGRTVRVELDLRSLRRFDGRAPFHASVQYRVPRGRARG